MCLACGPVWFTATQQTTTSNNKDNSHAPPLPAPQIKRLRQESEEKSASHATLAVKLAQAEAAEEQIREQLAQLNGCMEELAEVATTTEVGGEAVPRHRHGTRNGAAPHTLTPTPSPCSLSRAPVRTSLTKRDWWCASSFSRPSSTFT